MLDAASPANHVLAVARSFGHCPHLSSALSAVFRVVCREGGIETCGRFVKSDTGNPSRLAPTRIAAGLVVARMMDLAAQPMAGLRKVAGPAIGCRASTTAASD